jgi:hypothetical protein
MREWSISPEGPFSLRIAADARHVATDYVDDQIWELKISGGDPPALAIHTTYGLRARSMRIFPGFGWKGRSVTNPMQFASPPILSSFLPNYLSVRFFPFEDLEVQAEYWVVESHALGGRFTLTHRGSQEQEARLRLHAILRPGDNPQVMGETVHRGATILSGRTGSIAPIVFLAGGASVEQAAYPALAVSQILGPDESKSWVWVHAGLGNQAESFSVAREIATRTWDAEIARLELAAVAFVDIETGDKEWDAALAFAQRVAMRCFISQTRYLPFPSFVLDRNPDRGYSNKKDGSDYDWHWGGQSAAAAYVFLPQIIHAAPELAKGILRNFVAVQSPDGAIDGKPGLAGQRVGNLSLPLLATLAWKIYLQTEDRSFLESVYPSLLEFVEVWFTKPHDHDQDGHPEWDHVAHSSFESSPSFVRWHRWGQGLDIRVAETADLAAYLTRECLSLLSIANLLEDTDHETQLRERLERLQSAIESSWNGRTSSYHHVDRDTHHSAKGAVLGKGRGRFMLEVERSFDPPVRVLIRPSGEEGLSHSIKAFIHGQGPRGRSRVERLTERHFQWFWEFGTATSEKVYSEIERIEVTGLSEDFETELRIADFRRQDLTLLLPLWAGLPSPTRAEKLVNKTLLDPKRYWRTYGISSCSAKDPAYKPDHRDGAGGIWILWNTMLGEGLVDYGYVAEAAELVNRLMQAAINSLKTDKAFREYYNADEAEGLGERDHLYGLAPLELFLYTLGVRLISPSKVWLRPQNPFPSRIVLRWRDLKVECFKDSKRVTFPDGQQINVTGEMPQIAEQTS